MRTEKILLVCLVAILIFSTLVYAEVPKMINYQGKITTPQGALISDTFSMVFSIYADSTGGTALWTETQTSVKVEFGVFSVLLGSVNPIPATVFDGNTRYLGLKVGNDNEMTPRKAIVSVGYAYHSMTADTAHFAMPDADWTIVGDTIYHLNGRIGIGTANPAVPLHVKGESRFDDQIRIATNSGTEITGDDGNILNIGSPYGICLQTTTDSAGILLLTNLNNRTVIDGHGNVGIGTTSPVAKLDVNGLTHSIAYSGGSVDLSGVSNPDIRFISGSSDYRWEAGSDGAFYLYDQNATSYRLLFNSSGNVGIGTTSPAYKLDVNGDIRSTGTIYGNFAGTISYALDSDKLDGKHNGEVSADIWDGHHWGDKYPSSSNSDLLNGLEYWRFLRSDQSGTLNGSLTMGGDINLGSNRLNMTGERWLRPNFESDEIYLNTDLNTGIIFRFSDPYRKIRFSHDGTNGYITSYGSGGLVLQSSTNGITLDAANNVIAAERINPSVNNAFPLGGATERWADGWFVNLHYSGTLYHSHSVESKLPLNNTEIEDGDVIVYNPETGKWEKCNSEKTLDFVSVAAKSTAEEMKVDPENIEGFEGRPVILGVYHLKVIGKVKKGQILVSSSMPGCAKAVDATVENLPYRIGRPVELKDTEGIGMIKAYFNIK